LLIAAPVLKGNDAYRYDVVNLTRQVLGQRGMPLVRRVEEAYLRKDRAALLAAEAQVVSLLRDLDALTATRREFLLGRWIADARRWGTNDSERRLYEWNARNLITLWGTKCTEGQNDDLNLYAYKEWEGMFGSYFLPRWERFFEGLNASLEAGVPFDRAAFASESCDWEQRWSRETTSFRVTPTGDPVTTARRLARKWRVRGG
jgi:alpha-N-acetylglucosaminidase